MQIKQQKEWKMLREFNRDLKSGGHPWRARMATEEEVRTGKNLSGDSAEVQKVLVTDGGLHVVLQPIRQRPPLNSDDGGSLGDG